MKIGVTELVEDPYVSTFRRYVGIGATKKVFERDADYAHVAVHIPYLVLY